MKPVESIYEIIDKMSVDELESLRDKLLVRMNPFPATNLWEKTYRKDVEDWVDRQYELCQYPTIKEAMHHIMRLRKGCMSPQFIIDIGKRRGLE